MMRESASIFSHGQGVSTEGEIMQLPTSTAVTALPSPAFRRDLVALIPYLRAFSRALCRHRDLADDMAQDALAKAWRCHRQFETGTNLKAWLFTILRNEFYTHKRRSWRETHWDENKGEGIPAPQESPLWSLELSDTARALHALPDIQREALILVGAGGLSYADTAKICKTPLGTIKSCVARGRAALIQDLDDKQRRPQRRPTDIGGAADILAQLSVLMPKNAPSAAHA